MAEKHTPSPWHATDSLDRIHGGEVIRAGDADRGAPVAVICDFNRYDRDAERQANARLIAAAPDLLDACKTAVAWIAYATHYAPDLAREFRLRQAADTIERAIAKATATPQEAE